MPEAFTDPPRLTNHTLPLHHFDSLASGMGEPAAVRLLLDGEYSRRLLLLRALLDRASSRPALLAELPPAETAWNTFVEAQARAPEAFRAILLQPQRASHPFS